MDFLTSAVLLSWVAIVLLGLVVSRLILQVHQLQRQVAAGTRPPVEGRTARAGGAPTGGGIGLARGAPAPPLHPADSVPTVPAGSLLLFASADCRTCTAVLDEVMRWQVDRNGGSPTVRVLYPGSVPAPTTADDRAIMLGDQAAAFEAYDAFATPFAVVVDGSGLIRRSEPLGSASAARRLLDSLTTSPTGRTR